MWKFTVVADAKPAIILVVARTCFKSKYALELAAIVDPDCIATPSSVIVNVADDDNDIVHYIERVQYNDLFSYRRAEYKGILKAYDLYKREKIRSILDKNTILYNDLINIILDFV
jgi:hypothetical protein